MVRSISTSLGVPTSRVRDAFAVGISVGGEREVEGRFRLVGDT